MRKTRPPPGSPDDIEHAFYEAMQQGDLGRLMACWADEEDIACVHPGGQRLVGAAAIRAGFEALFASGPVQSHPEQVLRLTAHGSSVHHVVERVDFFSDDGPHKSYVLATNVYMKTAQGWRMVAHHGSPATAAPAPQLAPASGLLH